LEAGDLPIFDDLQLELSRRECDELEARGTNEAGREIEEAAAN
jgi:hypothetical protein